MQEKVISGRRRLEDLGARTEALFSTIKCFDESSEGYKAMKEIEKSIIRSFEERLPLSDDLLHFCFKWRDQISGGKVLESALWQAIESTVKKVLKIPIDPIAWTWFKENVFKASIFFEERKGEGFNSEEKEDGDQNTILEVGDLVEIRDRRGTWLPGFVYSKRRNGHFIMVYKSEAQSKWVDAGSPEIRRRRSESREKGKHLLFNRILEISERCLDANMEFLKESIEKTIAATPKAWKRLSKFEEN